MARLSNRDVDALIQGEYEDALAADEPWALEAYDARQPGCQRLYPPDPKEVT